MPGGDQVVMLLENNPYPMDVRVRREAESLARAGYRVTVVAPRASGEPRRELVNRVRVRRYALPRTSPTIPGFVLEYVVANLQLHARAVVQLARGARVVHLHNPPDTLFPAALLARALRRRVVYDQHDLVPELMRAKFGDSPVLALLRLMERASYRLASVVVVPNESHRAIARGRGGVAAERVFVVRNGPPEATLAPSANGRPGPLSDPHIVFLGSLESQDGVDLLPGVMRELAERHGLPRARLTVVGEGSRRRPLEVAFAADTRSGPVAFTGHVPADEVPRLLAQADICIDPAEPNDLNDASTMVKIAEYMAAGKPIVAHRLRETERTAGEAALYAGRPEELAGHLARLASEPELRASLGKLGLERAGGLSWERSERVLLEAYGRL